MQTSHLDSFTYTLLLYTLFSPPSITTDTSRLQKRTHFSAAALRGAVWRTYSLRFPSCFSSDLPNSTAEWISRIHLIWTVQPLRSEMKRSRGENRARKTTYSPRGKYPRALLTISEFARKERRKKERKKNKKNPQRLAVFARRAAACINSPSHLDKRDLTGVWNSNWFQNAARKSFN